MSIGVKKGQIKLTWKKILYIIKDMENTQITAKKEIKMSSKIYWVYLIGFFLIISQHINVIPPWFTPTDWGKSVCFRIIISILLFLFAWQIAFRKIDFKIIKDKIKSIAPAPALLFFFLGIYLLATIFSVNTHFSLWGDSFRNGGFINLFLYALLAMLSFLVIRGKDWQKIWDFSIIIGILVSAVALFQQFGILNKYLLEVESRPMSTIANAILLSIYSVLLAFPTLSFGFKAKKLYRKIFYFASASLFFFIIIFISQTRGAIIGTACGLLWFLFAYPKKIKLIKIYSVVFILLSVISMYFLKVYLDSHLDAYKKMPLLISSTVDRTLNIFEGPKISEARLSAWKISLKGLEEKPILGWGPENFMVAFDKYYDPSLPIIGPSPSSNALMTEWFDRAHNIALDISVSSGIPSFIVYLSFFVVLIWQLQKSKKRDPDNAVLCNGAQAAFIAYLVSLLFGFDSVSTYINAFILIGYSFYLVSNGNSYKEIPSNEKKAQNSGFHKYRWPIIIFLFIILFWFAQANVKAIDLTTKLNMALIYLDLDKCNNALNLVNKISGENSIVENYIAKKTAPIFFACAQETPYKDSSTLAEKLVEIMKETVNKYPQYTENWLLYGDSLNMLIENKNSFTNNVFVSTPETEELKKEVNDAFAKAIELSPNRQTLLKELALTGLITGDYEKAKEASQKCLSLNPYYYSCYWLTALADGYQGNLEGFNHYIDILKEKNYDLEDAAYLQQLINMYIATDNYEGLAETYPRLIAITSDPLAKGQLYASLAAAYQELGETEKARETALKILDLAPLMPQNLQAQVEQDVENFIKTLK